MLNELASGRERSLLDVGCGPGALRNLLYPNFKYQGIDIDLVIMPRFLPKPNV
jgi:hypothetical protein